VVSTLIAPLESSIVGGMGARAAGLVCVWAACWTPFARWGLVGEPTVGLVSEGPPSFASQVSDWGRLVRTTVESGWAVRTATEEEHGGMGMKKSYSDAVVFRTHTDPLFAPYSGITKAFEAVCLSKIFKEYRDKNGKLTWIALYARVWTCSS
jgi:hypothetical protein